MKGNDLSNVSMPRMIVVFEGAVGRLSDATKKYFDKYAAQKKWYRAIDCYYFDDHYCNKIVDLGQRQNYNISIVTWMPQQAAEAIEDQCARIGLPVRSVFSSTPEQLAKDLPFNPDIIRVYDPDPAHFLTYGGKGVHVTNANQLGI